MLQFLILLLFFLGFRFFEYLTKTGRIIKNDNIPLGISRFLKSFYYLGAGILLFLQYFYSGLLIKGYEIEVGKFVALMSLVEFSDLYFEFIEKENKVVLKVVKKAIDFYLWVVILLGIIVLALLATTWCLYLTGLIYIGMIVHIFRKFMS